MKRKASLAEKRTSSVRSLKRKDKKELRHLPQTRYFIIRSLPPKLMACRTLWWYIVVQHPKLCTIAPLILMSIDYGKVQTLRFEIAGLFWHEKNGGEHKSATAQIKSGNSSLFSYRK